MNRSESLSEHAWLQAEALIELMEGRLRGGQPAGELLEELVIGLQRVSAAQSVTLRLSSPEQSVTIAQAGVAVVFPTREPETQASHHQRISAARDWEHARRLVLESRFAGEPPLERRQPLQALSEALIDIASVLYLRRENASLSAQLATQVEHQGWTARLYRGAGLEESFAQIAGAIASLPTIDRVSLLQRSGRRYRLVASSSQPDVRRRSRHVRLLELAVANSLGQRQGDDDMAAYQTESGAIELHCEAVADGGAVVAVERFRRPESDGPLSSVLAPHRSIIRDAIAQALRREQGSWDVILHRCRRWLLGITVRRLAAVLIISGAALWLIPAPLRIPVGGRLMAASAHRIYAPAEGIVEEVLVDDGQWVPAGTPLLRLRSPDLDLQQQTLAGALSTARAKLDSWQVTRRRGIKPEPTTAGSSTDEQVLRTEITGLEAQLELIEQQQSELVIRSPREGRVDRWDLRSSLAARPVAVGHYLLAVVSPEDGWRVELNIPDQHVGYVLAARQAELDRVTYRVRSDPQRVYEGRLESIAEGAQLKPDGTSVVLATLPLAAHQAGQLHNGATVSAEIHCGRRPVGFVLFRGVIQWWRGTSWL